MTLDQLRYFCAVAKHEHIGKAAEQESISQPSLTISIKKLEAELGIPLLQSNGRGIQLTDHGIKFLHYAKNILNQVEEAAKQMQQDSDAYNQTIRMAYNSSVANHYIPHMFGEYIKSSKLEPLIYSNESTSDEIVKGIAENKYDFGICSQSETPKEIIQVPILHEPLVVITCKGHPLSKKKRFTIEDLAKEHFICYRESFPMYKQVSEIFKNNGTAPNITSYSYSEDSIAQLVEQGLGVSIIAKTGSVEGYDLEILKPSWLKDGRKLYLTYDKNRSYGLATKKMISFILEHV